MKSEIIKLYQDREDVTLTTYVLEDSVEMLKGKARPAVIICPGGAYLCCSDREGEPIAMAFASMGYHAFVLRYSTYMENGKDEYPDVSKPVKIKEQCQFPRPMQEIGRAMLLIKEHAKDWHVDEERIAICGFSAGAHNAAMYSVYWDKAEICGTLNVPADKLRPAATILGYTLSDYIYMKEMVSNSEGAFLFRASNTSFLGSPEPSEELFAKVSPARLVSESTPPMFLWSTAADELVPVQHTIRLAHALADHKIPFEMHIFEEGMHGLALATHASSSAHTEVNVDAAKWTGLAARWLEKRFALPLQEKTDWQIRAEKK